MVEFYSEAWTFLGTKSKLITVIEETTKIGREFLLDRESIKGASIATKFSWAALRKTTRVEDLAYCLLGLVQVNMPMLYGEGDRAFHRLQLEIIRQSNDHSIFAWEPVQQERQMTSVLAPAPNFFKDAQHIHSAALSRHNEARTYEVTNNGLRITLPCITVSEDHVVALLDCQTDPGTIVGVWLENLGKGKFQRLAGSRLTILSADEEEDADLLSMCVVIDHELKHLVSPAPCQIAVDQILADEDYLIDTVTVFTRHGIKNLRLILESSRSRQFASYYIRGVKERQTHFINYISHDLVLREGEAACIEMHRATKMARGAVIFGYRKGRAVVNFATPNSDPTESWYEQTLQLIFGKSQLDNDYAQKLMSGTEHEMITAESKKKYAEGTIRWTLTIRIFHCTCVASKDIQAVCVCKPSNLRSLKAFNDERISHGDTTGEGENSAG